MVACDSQAACDGEVCVDVATGDVISGEEWCGDRTCVCIELVEDVVACASQDVPFLHTSES